MLVDTLYDLASTRRMLQSMRSVLGEQALDVVVNTHANGDHCWGNGSVGRARIVSSRAAVEEMRDLRRLLQGQSADLAGLLNVGTSKVARSSRA